MLVDLQIVNNDSQSHYAGTAFRMWEPPSALSGKPDNKDTDCSFKAPGHKLASTKNKSRSDDIAKWIQQVKGSSDTGYRVPSGDVTKHLQNESLNSEYTCPIKTIPLKWQVEVNKGIEVENTLDDGYICQKFHEMSIGGANYPRCNSCDAKKLVQTSDDDDYKGIHTCLRLSATSDFKCESESALSILKNSDSSTTTELEVTKNSSSSTTVTDNSSGVNCAKIMSGSVSMERWKRQMEDIRFPNLKLQLASSNEPKWVIVSEVAEDSSWNLLSSSLKTPRNEKECPSDLKESEKELDDKITKLHQLVAPFGKNEAPAVLLETLGYIRFLHGQIKAYTTPHIKQGTTFEPQQQYPKQDLRSRGLCLIPVSSAFSNSVINQITPDFFCPTSVKPLVEPNAYKDE